MLSLRNEGIRGGQGPAELLSEDADLMFCTLVKLHRYDPQKAREDSLRALPRLDRV